MAQYRKIPVVIDAIQVFLNMKSYEEIIAWVESFGDDFYSVMNYDDGHKQFSVNTLEGTSYDVPDGYWIIRGIKGEYYPCAPDVFEKTYEAV